MATITRLPAEPTPTPHTWRESGLTERPSRPAWMDPPAADDKPAAKPAAKGSKS